MLDDVLGIAAVIQYIPTNRLHSAPLCSYDSPLMITERSSHLTNRSQDMTPQPSVRKDHFDKSIERTLTLYIGLGQTFELAL